MSLLGAVRNWGEIVEAKEIEEFALLNRSTLSGWYWRKNPVVSPHVFPSMGVLYGRVFGEHQSNSAIMVRVWGQE